MEKLKVSQLYIYPIKSLRGVPVTESVITDRGFLHDRRWMLVNENHTFITQRQYPQLSLVDISLQDDVLNISAPKMDVLQIPLTLRDGNPTNVKIWHDDCEALAGENHWNEWFSDYLDVSCKLVYMPESSKRKVDPKYARQNNEIVSFADGYPFLLISEGSLEELNRRLEIKDLPAINMKRFRPNIVVKGCEAFEEDHWKSIRIGNVNFYPVKPCSRCIVTTVDLDTGQKGTEPLLTLMEFRKKDNKVYFGQNLVHEVPLGEKGESIRVGQEILVLANNSHL